MHLCSFGLLIMISVLCVSREQITTSKFQDTDNYYNVDYIYDSENSTNGDYYYGDDYYYDYNYTYDDYYDDDDYFSDDELYDFYNFVYETHGYILEFPNEAKCAEKYSCNSTFKYCMCDANCNAFKDCCHDAELRDINTTAQKLKEVFPYAECTYFPEVFYQWFIFVVNVCPLSTGKTLKDLCENVEIGNVISSTPVIGNTTNLLYRNMYCAACHNEQYTLLHPKLSCGWKFEYEGNFTIEELLELDACYIEYTTAMKPNVLFPGHVRRCYPLVSECSNPSADGIFKKKCNTGRNEFVFTTNNIYRNKHCYICSKEIDQDVSCNIHDFNATLGSRRTFYRYSYRMLFDLESGRVKSEKQFGRFPIKEEFSIGSECSDTQVFDPFANSCRDMACTSGTQLNGLKCTSTNTSILKTDSCAAITFDENEYERLNNTSMFVYSSNKTYYDVVFDGNVAHVCITIHVSPTFWNKYDPIEGWLSFVCGLVSVICLCVTAMVYMLPKLQNQPGRLLFCLSLSLCLAQSVFFVAANAEVDSVLCKTLGILSHFFFFGFIFVDERNFVYCLQDILCIF